MTTTSHQNGRSCRTTACLALLFAAGAFGLSDLPRVHAAEPAAAAAPDYPLAVIAFASVDRVRARCASLQANPKDRDAD